MKRSQIYLCIAFAVALLVIPAIYTVAQDNINSRFATIDISKVTATADEVNALDGITSDVTQLNYLDITTPGTAEASKAIVLDSSKQIDVVNVSDLFKIPINATMPDTTGFLGGEIFIFTGDTLYVFKADHTIAPIF